MLPIEQSKLPEKELHASIATSLTTLCICFCLCLCLCLCLWQSYLPEKKLHASINPPFLPPLPRQRSLHPLIGKSKLPAIFNQRLSTIFKDRQQIFTKFPAPGQTGPQWCPSLPPPPSYGDHLIHTQSCLWEDFCWQFFFEVNHTSVWTPIIYPQAKSTGSSL